MCKVLNYFKYFINSSVEGILTSAFNIALKNVSYMHIAKLAAAPMAKHFHIYKCTVLPQSRWWQYNTNKLYLLAQNTTGGILTRWAVLCSLLAESVVVCSVVSCRNFGLNGGPVNAVWGANGLFGEWRRCVKSSGVLRRDGVCAPARWVWRSSLWAAGSSPSGHPITADTPRI